MVVSGSFGRRGCEAVRINAEASPGCTCPAWGGAIMAPAGSGRLRLTVPVCKPLGSGGAAGGGAHEYSQADGLAFPLASGQRFRGKPELFFNPPLRSPRGKACIGTLHSTVRRTGLLDSSTGTGVRDHVPGPSPRLNSYCTESKPRYFNTRARKMQLYFAQSRTAVPFSRNAKRSAGHRAPLRVAAKRAARHATPTSATPWRRRLRASS